MLALMPETRQRHAQALNVLSGMQELLPFRLDERRLEHSVYRVMIENRLAKVDQLRCNLSRAHRTNIQDADKQLVAPRVLDQQATMGP